MKTFQFLKGAFLAAGLMGAFAVWGMTWFETGLPEYLAWPADASDRVVPGVGSWTGTEGAELLGEAGVKRLVFGTAENRPLEFVPLAPASAAEDEVIVSFEILFSAGAESPAVDPAMKGALTVVAQGSGVVFAGLVKSRTANTNVWTTLTGATPVLNDVTKVDIRLRTSGGKRQVKYVANGVALASASGEWSQIVFPGDSPEIVGMGCIGAGELSDLSAQTSREVESAVLTIPELDWMTLASVKANGEALAAQPDGTYLVPIGAYVAVTFVPHAGAFLDNPTMVFRMEGAMALPETGRPSVIPPSEILAINEIMASNGSTLLTANRQAGLDWIEIRNKSETDVDITGWYLSDNPTKKPSKWSKIEGSCVIPAGGYKIVWADTGYLNFAENEAYTRIGLSSDGETVFLATPEGEMVHSVTFGPQLKDVSIGVGGHAQTLVSATGAAEWRVGDGAWQPVSGTVGTSAAVGPGFTVVACATKAFAADAAAAEADLADPACWAAGAVPTTNVCAALTGVTRLAAAQGVMCAETTILVPAAGQWTFFCGGEGESDLVISHGGLSWTVEYPTTSATFSFPEGGAYDVKLVCRAHEGAAAPTLLVGAGELDAEADAARFAPLGAAGGTFAHTGRYAAQLATNLLADVNGAGEFDWRSTFTCEAVPAPADTIQLRIRYADGFTAKLNGTTFAKVAPSGARAKGAALADEYFAVPSELFTVGENTLKITVKNDDPADPEMLLSAELLWSKAGGDMAFYFPKPTPGRANGADAKDGPTPKVAFSEPHGYKTAAFTLSLSCPDQPDATIYYTLDGTAPTVKKTRYTGPITISRTTVVRAAVPNADSILQMDASATYLFLNDIITQSGVPSGFPSSGSVNGQAFIYGMRSEVVNNATYRPKLLAGFTNSIATLSLVIDPANLFNASTGIYVNANNNGRAWERTTMLELINPTNTAAEFSVPSGIRIRGAYSRGSSYPKHSFRFFFRNEYGMSKLKFKLFDDEGADSFDKVDLRTAQNYSWANGSGNFTFIEECFSRDSQRDLGQSYHRSRYYNLFINGIYWGVYQTEERTCGEFGETYFGGNAEDYDVVRTSQPGYVTGIVEGNETGWKNFWDISVNQGYGSGYPNNYNLVRGLKPDGTPDPTLPIYLNATNVAAYMLTAHYASDADSPSASGSDKANNNAQLWNRYNGTNVLGGITTTGWIFHRHDAEHSLGTSDGVSANNLNRGTEAAHANMKLYKNFNAAELHYKLLGNAEYKMLVADFMFRHCVKEGGAMTAPEARKRFEKRMAELDDAVVCESARWGYGKSSSYVYSQWISACNSRLSFIENRLSYLIQYYQGKGWYPTIQAPRVCEPNGAHVLDGKIFAAGDALYLSKPSTGTIYYTLDGTDPRAVGGAVKAGALTFTGTAPGLTYRSAFAKKSAWQYYDRGSQPAADSSGRVWYAKDYATTSSWGSGNGILGFNGSTATETIGTQLYKFINHASSGTQVYAYYFRKTFTLPAAAADSTSIRINILYDDCYAIYINGTEVDRLYLAKNATYSTFSDSGTAHKEEISRTVTIPAGLLREGANTIAVEVHQNQNASSDIYFDHGLHYATYSGGTGAIEVPAAGARIRARIRTSAGEWSPLESVDIPNTTAPEASALARGLRVAEVMSASADEDASGNAGDGSEFIVLTNLLADASLNLAGVQLTCTKTGNDAPSLSLELPEGLALAPHAALTLTKAAYWPSAKITNGKVDLLLFDSAGSTIQTAHVETSWFASACDGTGASFLALAFGDTVTTEADWAPSFVPPADATGAKGIRKAIAADDAVRTWVNGLWQTAEGQTAIAAFGGDKAALRQCYLVNALPETEPEIEVTIPTIVVNPDGTIAIGGRLFQHGLEAARTVNGEIRLYHAPTLDGLPGATEPVPFGKTFPVAPQPVAVPEGKARFFQLRVE